MIGAWVVYTWDWNPIVQSIHPGTDAGEMEALRIVNAQGYGKVAFLEFGADPTVVLA